MVSIPLPQINIPHFRFGSKDRAASGRARATSATPRARAIRTPTGTGKAGDQAGRARARGRAVAGGAGRRSWARSCSCRASSPRASSGSSRRRTSTRHPPHRPGVAAPLPAHLPAGAAPPDHDGHLRPEEPDHRPDARGQALSLVAHDAAAAVERGHHLHDGRVGLDGRRAEGDRPHRVASGSTPGCARSTRASSRRYIIHDAMAKEVDRDTFFRTRESGGTMISSAYKLCAKMIEDEYPPERVEHLSVPLLRR